MIEYSVERSVWNDNVRIYARDIRNGKSFAVVCDGLKLVEGKEGELWPALIDLPMIGGSAQSLFDALWQAGFRPNNGESSVAHVNAVNRHLEDMRTLVFKEKA